ncbi:MAG: SUMF1/EgtB/PvdO family nonheme iron enzyme [Pseudomonadota bacterium]
MHRRPIPTSAALGLCLMSAIAVAAAIGPAEAWKGQTPPDYTALDRAPFTPQNAPHSARAQNSMLTVSSGTYTLGRNNGPRVERPAHSVDLQAFRIDRTEVTNAAFAEYLNALGIAIGAPFAAGGASRKSLSRAHAALIMEGRKENGRYPIIALDDDQARIGYENGAFVPTRGYEDHPVTETTWAGARAYCVWRGGRLPTEAEWEAAARGNDYRLYPWGNALPDRTRVFVSGRTGVTGTVGRRPAGASPSGALDMSGSLAEWTSSLMRPYPYNANDGREAPDRPGERVTRGGDYIFDSEPATLTATHRKGFSNAPERGHRHIGFRCAAASE